MESRNCHGLSCKKILHLLYVLGMKMRKLYSKIPCFAWRKPRPRVVIRKLVRFGSRSKQKKDYSNGRNASHHRNGEVKALSFGNPIRVATFNAALFAMAPVLPKMELGLESNGTPWCKFKNLDEMDCCSNSPTNLPRSILKNSPLHTSLNGGSKLIKSKMRVSINLPENEISKAMSRSMGSTHEVETLNSSQRFPVRSPLCFPTPPSYTSDECLSTSKTIYEVLREVDADILALQDVKADEEKGMQPLADLARLLGMNYVFAESWAPEYGNAILSKWPILRWKVQKIANDEDIRNVLKATIKVPRSGEVNMYCTQFDYLDEKWRMKQVNAILGSSDEEGPHILAGGLNSLDRSDYSSERWIDIVKYFEEIGKPKPKDEVMSFMKQRGYQDAKNFAGECEPAVIIAKGQDVQGTCKYGTRVDYILSSSNSEFKFIPGSYTVISSKGTSDHHIVKVDIVKLASNYPNTLRNLLKEQRKATTRKVVRNICSNSTRGTWMMDR